jgi:hypothetical protein
MKKYKICQYHIEYSEEHEMFTVSGRYDELKELTREQVLEMDFVREEDLEFTSNKSEELQIRDIVSNDKYFDLGSYEDIEYGWMFYTRYFLIAEEGKNVKVITEISKSELDDYLSNRD